MSFAQHRVYNGGGPVSTVAGRIRTDHHRFVNDAGAFSWRSVSDLAALGYMLSGREGEVLDRFDHYQRAGRTMVRVLGMLGEQNWAAAGLAFSPSTPGYKSACEVLVSEANRRGMYVEFCLFADAQIVMPDAHDRERAVDDLAVFCLVHTGVVPQLANEAFKNGWSEADDPALLALADRLAATLGHRNFSISDPVDGDNPDASAATTARFKTLALHSNIIVLHPDRSYGTDSRWRRWIDHLEGMTDVVNELSHDVSYAIDEPIGAALTEQPGRRDADPDAFIAAQFVALCCGFGFTYHKIDSEIPVAQLPGFYEVADLLARVPTSSDWRYLNDSWPGSPTEGITWIGKEGKMRHLVRGNQAWSVAYGEADWNSVKWRPGFTPSVVYAGQRVMVWTVNL